MKMDSTTTPLLPATKHSFEYATAPPMPAAEFATNVLSVSTVAPPVTFNAPPSAPAVFELNSVSVMLLRVAPLAARYTPPPLPFAAL